MQKLLLLIGFFSLCLLGNAQKLDLTAYTFSSFSIGTNKQHKWGAELKVFVDQSFKEMPFDLAGMYHFPRKTLYQFSVGAGVQLAPFRGFDEINYFIVPVQAALFPLKKCPQLSLVAEFTPLIRSENEAWGFRQLWGVRYALGKR